MARTELQEHVPRIRASLWIDWIGMAAYYNYRRQIALVILFFLVFFAFAAYSSNYWLEYSFVAAIWAVLIIVDFMFLDETTFVYDPNYKSWGIKSGSNY